MFLTFTTRRRSKKRKLQVNIGPKSAFQDSAKELESSTSYSVEKRSLFLDLDPGLSVAR